MSNWLLVVWWGFMTLSSSYFFISHLFKVAEDKKHPEIAFIKKEIKDKKAFIEYLDKQIAECKQQIKIFVSESIVESAKSRLEFDLNSKKSTLKEIADLEAQLKELQSRVPYL